MINRTALLLLSFISVISSFAQTTFIVDGIRYQIVSDTERTVGVSRYEDVNGSLYEGSIIIPDIVNYNNTNYKVTSINDSAFYESKITSIIIPSSIDSIGCCAFFGCKSIESIIIPYGVRTISDNTFNGCQSLSYLLLPASIKAFGKSVFGGCYSLESAGPMGGGYNYEFSWNDTIPGSAFNGLFKLRSVYIPKSVRLINDQGIFYEYYYHYGPNYVYVLYKAFYFEGCANLESLAISFSNTKILRRESSSIRYKKESPVDNDFFIGTPIHSITILDDTVKLKNDESWVFSQIDEIVISEYVKNIHPAFFTQVRNIKKIGTENSSALYSSTDGVLFNKSGNELLAYPPARDTTIYSTPNGVTMIVDHAFNKNSNLQCVNISEDVEMIGDSAFESCQSLNSVNILGSPQIKHNAFVNCPNIEFVSSLSATPGIIQIMDDPKAYWLEPDLNDRQGLIMVQSNDKELGRNIYKIYHEGYNNWSYDITSTDIPAGKYKVNIGILPNIEAQRPNFLHPMIAGITDSTDVVLYEQMDSVEEVDAYGGKYMVAYCHCITNDISGYDSLLIADTLTIPEGLKGIKIKLTSVVNDENSYKYTSTLWLDRIFFEPLDKEMPIEKYAGPFDEAVFNNATLLVPEGSVDTYKSSKGWNLFKNIQVNTAVKPVYQDNEEKVEVGLMIYDILGRRLKEERLNMLLPGLYIINGKKIIIK